MLQSYANAPQLALLQAQHARPSTLAACLTRFASPEQLEDTILCKKCNGAFYDLTGDVVVFRGDVKVVSSGQDRNILQVVYLISKANFFCAPSINEFVLCTINELTVSVIEFITFLFIFLILLLLLLSYFQKRRLVRK